MDRIALNFQISYFEILQFGTSEILETCSPKPNDTLF